MNTPAFRGFPTKSGSMGSEASVQHGPMGKSMTTSFVLHALLFLVLIFTGGMGGDPDALTEISWVDGEGGGGPSEAPPQPQVVAPPAPSGTRPQPEHFERDPDPGEAEPQPQDAVLSDRLEERLASLQQQESNRRAAALPALVVGTGGKGDPTLAPGGPAAGPGGSPLFPLRRESSPVPSRPLALKRVEERSVAPVAAAIPPKTEAPRAARQSDSTAQRELAGATLLGPVANRKLLAHPTPHYPDWAKREGIEASVRLYFIVQPDGSVQEDVAVEKTSGYGDFDDNALLALRAWKFEPLRDAVGDQWGRITFHYRLRDGIVE